MNKYLLDAQFPQLFAAVGMDTGEVLRLAHLPEDLFSKTAAAVTGEEYLRLMDAVGKLAPADDFAIQLATSEGIERFNPPIFAAYCTRDGLRCIERLREFKPLIGPVRYRLEQLGPETTLYMEGQDVGTQIPAFAAEGEIAFILHVVRTATKQEIKPVQVEVAFEASSALQQLVDAPLTASGVNAVTFKSTDLVLPFISYNEGMWSYFEPELSRRLSQLEIDESVSARVRACLVELLPAGENTIEDVARKLATSARTLQRQLSDEGTTFRKQLNHVRQLLAQQYLSTSKMNMDTIAFMLGYAEAGSFIRAFTLWTDSSPATYRAEHGK